MICDSGDKMDRIIIGFTALVIFFVFGYFGLPIIYRNAPSSGSISIFFLLIFLGIATVCLERPIRNFCEQKNI